MLGVQTDSLVEVGDGLGKAFLRVEGMSAVEMTLERLRIEPDRLGEIGDRPVVVPLVIPGAPRSW